ncbi:MAG: ADOP family duplicated permease [Vicinamibacterales bacterium]
MPIPLPRSLRALRAHAGYAAAAVTTLALGVGATTAMFSAVHAVLLAPQAIGAPGDVVVGWGLAPERSHGLVELTYRDIEAMAAASRTVGPMAAVGASTWTAVLEEDGAPTRLPYAGVSGAFFATLGVEAALGRALGPEDDRPGGPAVLVLSHATWRDRFGADPAIVGRRLRLDGALQTVVGVMPPDFDYPRGAAFWAPLAPGLAAASAVWKTDVLATVGVLFYVGRLKDGATLEAAAADLSAIGRGLDAGRPGPRVGSQVVVMPLVEHVIGPARRALWALLGAVLVLWLVACVNVSGLMLTRVTRLGREHAVQVALGASPATLSRQWLAEAATLAALGGGLGVVVAAPLTRAMLALAPEGIPRLANAGLDAPVILAALVATALAAAACGAGPARLVRRASLLDALHESSRATAAARPLRWRSALLVGQVALAVVLLVAAGLVARSFQRLRALDLGFQPAQVLSLQIDPQLPPERVNGWMAELIARLATRPEVDAVGAVYLRPLALGPIGQGTTVVLEGQPDTPETTGANPLLNYQVATPGYFAAMRIPLRAGRLFTDADRDGAERVVVVGESTARRLWPGRSAIGQRLRTAAFDQRPGAPKQAWRRVVGVVADVRYRGLDEVSLDLYDPPTQSTTPATDLMVRTSGPPLALAALVGDEARRLAPGVIVDGVTTLEAIVERARAPWRFGAWVFALFAVVTTALTAIGLFSVVALDVARRRREFAVRLALGASAGAVIRHVVAATGRRVALGVGVGLVAASASAAGIRGLLYGVPALDLPTYAGVAGVIGVVVLAAAFVPVRRATRIAPAEVLRDV